MQKFFLVFFIFLSTMASAQTGVIMRGQTPDGKTNTYLQLSDEGLLKISGDIEIGDVSIESIPSYKDGVGDATRAIVDSNERVIINIDSESNLLFDKLNEVISSNASETNLIDALTLVRDSIDENGANASETVLINKLDEILSATTSSTALVNAIDLVKTEIINSGINASETVLLSKLDELISVTPSESNLIDKLDEIVNSNASETNLINAIDLVKTEIINSGVNASETVILSKLDEVIASIASETVLVNAIDTTDSIMVLQNPRILTIGVDEATIIGDIGTSKAVYIYTDNDLNFGGIEVASGTSEPFIPGGAPFVKFNFSYPTPAFFMIGREATATVRIWEAQ